MRGGGGGFVVVGYCGISGVFYNQKRPVESCRLVGFVHIVRVSSMKAAACSCDVSGSPHSTPLSPIFPSSISVHDNNAIGSQQAGAVISRFWGKNFFPLRNFLGISAGGHEVLICPGLPPHPLRTHTLPHILPRTLLPSRPRALPRALPLAEGVVKAPDLLEMSDDGGVGKAGQLWHRLDSSFRQPRAQVD